jgi:hypothetical protein
MLLSLAAATTADAQQGVLYEVTENMYLLDENGNPVGNPAVAVSRMADASLSGWAALGTPLCPNEVLWIVPNATRCTINAKGVDLLDIREGSPTRWKGSVSGTYTVVVQDDNAADAPEFVIESGSFEGQMDLSHRPLGDVSGTFKSCSSCTGTAFSGRFRLPFKVALDGSHVTPKRWEPAFYLLDDGATKVWVGLGEYSLGYATVKLELRFP